MNRNSNFWISYADLMTSLFFIMLVLFIVLVGRLVSTGNGIDVVALQEEIDALQRENQELKNEIKKISGEKDATEEQLSKLAELFNVQEKIDQRYFTYDANFKRFTLKNFSAKFNTQSSQITDIPLDQRNELLKIGKSLKQTFEKAQEDTTTKEAQYLLIVEGQASNDSYPHNYELSYERALSLVKYWNSNGIKFPSNCEIIISGSGKSSIFRDKPDVPPKNQRFVIHIVPKPGKIPSVENN